MRPQDNVLDLLRAASDWLADNELSKGAFGRGLLVAHKPKGDKPWPKPKEIYPWLPNLEPGGDLDAKENQGKIYKMVACSAMGAICFAAKLAPDATEVQSATMAATACLETRGIHFTLEAWSDADNTTKEQVVALLRAAAEG